MSILQGHTSDRAQGVVIWTVTAPGVIQHGMLAYMGDTIDNEALLPLASTLCCFGGDLCDLWLTDSGCCVTLLH